MKEQLIEFETAKLVKEKGFNHPTLCFYGEDENVYLYDNPMYHNNNDSDKRDRWSCPTQSLLQRWLREEHDLTIQIIPEGFDKNTAKTNWCYLISRLSDKKTREDYLKGSLGQDGDLFLRPESINSKDWYLKENKTYEEALEKGLYESLKLIGQ